MRVYPPVPTLTREAERDMDLGGYKVEKGTMLGVAVFSMHNNPAYWKVSIWKLLLACECSSRVQSLSFVHACMHAGIGCLMQLIGL